MHALLSSTMRGAPVSIIIELAAAFEDRREKWFAFFLTAQPQFFHIIVETACAAMY